VEVTEVTSKPGKEKGIECNEKLLMKTCVLSAFLYEPEAQWLSTPSAGEPFRERKFDKSVSHPFLRKEADRSPNYPDSAHGIPKFTSIDGRSQVRSGFPGIEASSSMLQYKIPPLRAKSVHLSVNLPLAAQRTLRRRVSTP